MKASFTKLRLAAASVLGLVFGLNALAQAPRAPQLESPVVHPDRTVTFNFRAPNARKVELSAQFLKANQPLTADTNGVWSLTVGPVEPNLYPYAAAVDPQPTNKKLKLLWLGVGKADFLYQQAVTFDDYLIAKRIEHQSLVTEGGHTWMNARHYLSETLQLYFK